MTTYTSVMKVKTAEDDVLSIDFEFGEHDTLDMKPFLDFAVFRRLMDGVASERVLATSDTIAWVMEIDRDPEFVDE